MCGGCGYLGVGDGSISSSAVSIPPFSPPYPARPNTPPLLPPPTFPLPPNNPPQDALRELEMPRFTRRYPALLNSLVAQMVELVKVEGGRETG